MTNDKKTFIDSMTKLLKIYSDAWQEVKENNVDHDATFNYADGMINGMHIALALLQNEQN